MSNRRRRRQSGRARWIQGFFDIDPITYITVLSSGPDSPTAYSGNGLQYTDDAVGTQLVTGTYTVFQQFVEFTGFAVPPPYTLISVVLRKDVDTVTGPNPAWSAVVLQGNWSATSPADLWLVPIQLFSTSILTQKVSNTFVDGVYNDFPSTPDFMAAALTSPKFVIVNTVNRNAEVITGNRIIVGRDIPPKLRVTYGYWG